MKCDILEDEKKIKLNANDDVSDISGGSAAAAGVVQVTIKPFSIDYIRQIRRPS